MEASKLLIFLNSNLELKHYITYHPNLALSEILTECKQAFRIAETTRCKLYESTGGEVDDDDLEYLNTDEPLFLSIGEPFNRNSNIALYEQLQELGQGGYGRVVLCRNRVNKEEVAVKFVSHNSLGSPEEINRIYSEINILRELTHPNIVRLKDAFTVDGNICFVMEYCSGGELLQYILDNSPLPEPDVYNITTQICEAIRYCHNAKIIHRDLKPENVLLANKFSLQIKVVDFGISGMFTVGRTGEVTTAGSDYYLPPEIVGGKDFRASPAMDVWAIGCIIYCMLTGNHPFTQDEDSTLYKQRIYRCEYKKLPETVTRPWHRLIRGIFRQNPKKRWKLLRICEYLNAHKNNPEVSSDSEIEKSFEEEEKKQQEEVKRGPQRASKSRVLSPEVKRENRRVSQKIDYRPRGKGKVSTATLPRKSVKRQQA